MTAATFSPSLAVDVPLERVHALESRALELAANLKLWQRHVRFGTPRVCVPIEAGPDAEVWLLMWAPGQGTGLHDHGGSSGCFTVLQGTITETVIDADGHPQVAEYSEGQVRNFDSAVVHDVSNFSNDGVITLHVYRPVLAAMTHYALEDDGLREVETRVAGRDW